MGHFDRGVCFLPHIYSNGANESERSCMHVGKCAPKACFGRQGIGSREETEDRNDTKERRGGGVESEERGDGSQGYRNGRRMDFLSILAHR